jgi:alkanesulfonate monooxygenase SsuD/methylene tetrahydromethanopterin reductase-like flavin-dependent oxidoreductase (luciferase family)
MTNPTGFKKQSVAMSLGSRSTHSKEEIIKLAQAAESLGYEAIFFGESWGRDLVSLMTMVALNTKRIKLGTSIAGVWARTPGLMIQTALSLDDICNGRLILGMGSGNLSLVKDWHGLPANQPVQRTREYIDILRMGIRGEKLQYEGNFFKLDGRFQTAFKGPRDYIPIYIGSAGPKMTELAGEISDGWMPTHSDILKFDLMKEDFAKGAKKANRNPNDFEVIPSMPACVDEDGTARQRFRENRALYIAGLSDRYYKLTQRFGFGEEADRIKDAWDRGDYKAAANAVSDEMIDRSSIIGTPDHCRKQLEACWNAGMHMPRISVVNPDLKVVYKTMEVLAPTNR